MSKEQVIDYVMTTPGNPNKAVLSGMLDDLAGGSSNSNLILLLEEHPKSGGYYLITPEGEYLTIENIKSNAVYAVISANTSEPLRYYETYRNLDNLHFSTVATNGNIRNMVFSVDDSGRYSRGLGGTII